DIKLKQRSVDMKQLTDVVFTIIKPLTSGKTLQLINNIPNDTPFAYGDEDRLHQILLNLIGNAIKFSHKGSVTVDAILKKDKLQIRVSDTGIGIPKDKHEDIFGSFEQADGSIEREYGGTGLGLSVTKSLVKLHGGNIWVKSEMGKGSTFNFTLPVSKDEMKAPFQAYEKLPAISIDDEQERESHDEIQRDAVEKDRRKKERRVLHAGPPAGKNDRRQGVRDRREEIIIDDLQGIKGNFSKNMWLT
ncbi:MAG: hypothetical protein GY714_09770, partial [Desulfobacterales bacterium]|nr:hypothetical protein [Desulfobacterales bacterium]